MTISRHVASLSLLLFGTVFSNCSRAAESYDNCTGFIDSIPATIDSQGTWCLRKDVSTGISSGYGILVLANNVTVDCNNFKVGGLAAGAATSAKGISIPNGFNTTIRNCNIRGFEIGIVSSGGGGHLIEDNSLDGNTRYGMAIYSAASTVRNNVIRNTGGSTSIDGATGISTEADIDIINNTINGVTTLAGDESDVRGIESISGVASGGSITGNRVRGLAPGGVHPSIGILSVTGTVIRGNEVQGSGSAGTGILCFNNSATSRDNVVSGFATGVANCMSSDDSVIP